MRSPLLALSALCLSAAASFADVNVYSYRQPELVAPMFDAFTAKTGIEVKVVFLQKGMLERLQAEGARSPADLIMTTDISRLNELAKAGVTQSVSSDVLSQSIPAEFRDPAGEWFGLTSRARVIYASKDRVAEGEITTYEDLADAKWEGRVCTRPGTHSYNLALISGMIASHGEDETMSWLDGVKGNLARKPQGNDRAQVKAIWAGECDISLGNTYYMGLMLSDEEQKEWADSVRIVFPTFEGGGTHVNLSGMALTKSSPNRDEAVQLMEFLASGEAQSLYAEANFEYPLSPGTKISGTVAQWGSFTPDATPLSDIAKLRAQALKLVQEVNFDG